jgi:hypothetical protein
VTEAGVEVATPASPGKPRSRRSRLVEVAAWIIGVVVLIVILQLLGVDVTGWLSSLWGQMKAVPPGYIVAALVFQTGQTVLTGLSYYGILGAAYPGEVAIRPIVTAYAVGVAANGFLPANIGTFITLMMFIAIIPGMNFGGAIAAYLVQKIFFTLAGTFVYLYLFLSVPGSFDISFSNITDNPAKQGGVILSQPGRYMTRVFLPSFLGYLCKLTVVGIFLAAFAIPVTFNSIMWVVGSGSLANVASFTPGAVGITQATNALALKTCCGVANDTAIAYSTAQQLITTAWNVLFATLAVVYVFGWTGGKQLVGGAYVDAKEKSTEMREERKRKKQERKAEEAASGPEK